MRAAVLALAIALLGGCPKPLPPTPVQPDGFAYCAPGAAATQEGVCNDLFTADGHACVKCTNGAGCVAPGIEVYCVASSSCLDPACVKPAAKRRPLEVR